MKKINTLLAIFIALFSLGLNAQDTVSYWGFEDGTTMGPMGSNWNNTGKTWVHEMILDDAANAYAGSAYFKAEVSEPSVEVYDNQAVYQELPIEAHTSYRFTMWAKAEKTGDAAPHVNITAGSYNGWKEFTAKYETKIGEDWAPYNIMIAIEDPAEMDLVDADGRYGDTIRIPVHYPIQGIYYVDEVSIVKSTIAGIAYNKKQVVVDFGYNLEYIPEVSADAFTITAGGSTVAATSAEMILLGDTLLFPKVYLTLDTDISQVSGVTVSYTGAEDLIYSGYSPVTDEYKAAAFTNEVARLDPSIGETGIINRQAAAAIDFDIYPNPATTSFVIDATENITSVTIFDLTGKMVKTLDVQMNNNVTVNIEELTSGVYMVRVMDANGTVSARKLMK